MTHDEALQRLCDYYDGDLADAPTRNAGLIADVRAAHAREVEAARCQHGWRGSVPEERRSISTPCPACGCRSLFIGSGGHLTCSRVPGRDDSGGCTDPSVEEAIKHKVEAAREEGATHAIFELLNPTAADIGATRSEPYIAGEARDVIDRALTEAREAGRREAWREAAKDMRFHLTNNNQDPASWHEVQDLAEEFERRAGGGRP